MENYEGDYGCSAHEGDTQADRCPKVATQVWREPFTPRSFAVILCDECGDGARAMGYTFDAEATAQLCRDVEREEELEAVSQ